MGLGLSMPPAIDFWAGFGKLAKFPTMDRLYLSVDLGGTSLRIALMNASGDILELRRSSSDLVRESEDLIKVLQKEVRSFLTHHPEVAGLALGIPGLVDGEKGIVFESPHFPLWKEFPLRARLKKHFTFPILMDNDANQAALGEGWLGAGQGESDFILLTLGTGVGGGIFSAGKIFRGAKGLAGEIGHMVIERQGPVGAIGIRGTLESFASQSGLRLRLQDLKKNWPQLSDDLLKLDEKSPDLPAALSRLALAGDPSARKLWSDFGRALACGIGSLTHAFGNLFFILGGGLSGAWDLFFPTLKDELEQRLYPYLRNQVKVVPAQLGDKAGLIGGVRALLNLESKA